MPQQLKENPSRTSQLRRVVVACLLVGLIATLFAFVRNESLLQTLVHEQARLTTMLTANPLLVLAAAFLVYVLVTGLSLPGAAVLTLLISYLLQQRWPGTMGVIIATVLVSFASTAGASCAFLLARYLLRDAVTRRLGPRLSRFDESLRSEGPFYLFALRLIPVVPFFVINLAAGLTPLRLGTFWWVSQIGMLPGTIAYVVVGASLPDLSTLAQDGAGKLLTPQMVAALAILGLLPLGSRLLVKWWRGRNESHH